MALNAQDIVETLVATDEETLMACIQAIIESRPELASPLVDSLIPDLTYPPARALTDKRAAGRIKSLSEKTGYGFIDCQELKAENGENDIFLHHKQATGFQVGQEVTFAVMLNKTGKLQAYDLAAPGKGDSKGGCAGGCVGKGKSKGGAGGALMAMMQAMNSSSASTEEEVMEQMFYAAMAAKGGKGEGMGKGATKGVKRAGGKDEAETVGTFIGNIKSFNTKNGYGFISCPDLNSVGCPNDVFLHHAQLNGFEVGDAIQFTVYMNSKGQPQAKDVVAAQGETKKLKFG